MIHSIIQVNNLCKLFRIKLKGEGFWEGIKSLTSPDYKEIIAVDHISFNVDEGEVLAFIGPNGAGKSTTIKMLTGILYPTSGDISILGFNPSTDRMKLAYKIGTVFGQKAQLWFHLPPIDTYRLFCSIYELDRKEFEKRLQFLAESFEIEEYLKTPVRKLSLGQRMRCEIVGSLLHRPKVLFLDEPTIGLDMIAKQQVRDVIKFLNEEEKVTIFLTSHDAGDIETLTRRSIIINHGLIIFDDTTATLKKEYITTKIVELVLEEDAQKFNFDRGLVVARNKHSLRVEIDTTPESMEKLLFYAFENFTVKDINISERPLEEIIAAIYKEPKV